MSDQMLRSEAPSGVVDVEPGRLAGDTESAGKGTRRMRILSLSVGLYIAWRALRGPDLAWRLLWPLPA